MAYGFSVHDLIIVYGGQARGLFANPQAVVPYPDSFGVASRRLSEKMRGLPPTSCASEQERFALAPECRPFRMSPIAAKERFFDYPGITLKFFPNFNCCLSDSPYERTFLCDDNHP